jgi:hypothetical protein
MDANAAMNNEANRLLVDLVNAGWDGDRGGGLAQAAVAVEAVSRRILAVIDPDREAGAALDPDSWPSTSAVLAMLLPETTAAAAPSTAQATPASSDAAAAAPATAQATPASSDAAAAPATAAASAAAATREAERLRVAAETREALIIAEARAAASHMGTMAGMAPGATSPLPAATSPERSGFEFGHALAQRHPRAAADALSAAAARATAALTAAAARTGTEETRQWM